MPATPDTMLQDAIDRLAAAGASPIDQRNALAVLALIAAGFDPQAFATSRRGRGSSARLGLGLDLTAWPRVVELLEAAGVVTGAGRGGRRWIAR